MAAGPGVGQSRRRCSRQCWSGQCWSGQGPLLVGAAVAGVEDELSAVGGVGSRVVQALAGGRVDQFAGRGRPLLFCAAVARPPLDQGAVGRGGPGDVHAAAVDGEGAVAVHGPVLGSGVAVAVPHLDLVAVGGAGVVVVHALGAVVAGHDRAGRPGGAPAVGGVAGRDDAGLDRAFGRRRRVAGGHDALVEGARRALAVVTADAEDDRAFLVHRVVTGHVGPGPAVEGRHPAGLGVAAQDGPLVGLALDHGGGEPVGDGRVIGVVPGVDPGVQAVLHVGHDPRAVAGAVAPDLDVAEVDGFHVTVAGVVVAGLGVAVVETAAAVVVRAVEDRVLALGAVAGGDARGVVVPVAGTRGHVDAVGLVAANRHRGRGRVGQHVRPAGRPARRRAGQVVAV